MQLASLAALAAMSPAQVYTSPRLDTMVQQSGVILYNLIQEMNRQDLSQMTAGADGGVCLVGGILGPGQALVSKRQGPGSGDYHYLLAAASHVNAKIAFRIRNPQGQVVRQASPSDSNHKIYTTVRESFGQAGTWQYEAVNTETAGEPVFVLLLTTRSGAKGWKFESSRLFNCIESLSKEVADMKAENWGFTRAFPAVAAGVLGPNQPLIFGPFDMAKESFVVTAGDGGPLNLYLTNGAGDILQDGDEQGSRNPFAGYSGNSSVTIRVLNTSRGSAIASFAFMKPL